MKGDALVDVEQQNELLLVKLNRPDKRNAVNEELLLCLEAVFSAVPTGIKCAVLHSEGPHFSAGLDLNELKERDLIDGMQHSRTWHRALDQIQFGPVPVVAVLRGACIGGGLEIAAACHIRVAEQGTFYALPEGQRGIFVGGGASVRLPKLMGMARMADMMFTGRMLTADEGLTLGLSQYITPPDAGLAKGIELARKIAQNTPMTNYALMHILPRITDSAHAEGLLLESLTVAMAQSLPEAKQRLTAFLDGKAPKAFQ
ncbi:Enoyl-CoA hydratase/isomerase [Fibrisoma limi BUZ 3]|uniref:Enoyl-CoA hydratase/isomerase n=1 Tax=Fibrisoma limi BUZ 3 TaxID=1185876 RepID=I2GK29_9BACT|nr:crotonase/enoyl-CoA hydratase family protein [Fibrisoma limi]CCH54254.1 Enoyl-CoA hydratase/isomerase [Fibrisoma limi BUZ 3]